MGSYALCRTTAEAQLVSYMICVNRPRHVRLTALIAAVSQCEFIWALQEIQCI